MSTRIYVVSRIQPSPGAPDTTHRLVRARSQAQALRHVAAHILAVDHASQDVLVRLLGKGVVVEAVNTEDGMDAE